MALLCPRTTIVAAFCKAREVVLQNKNAGKLHVAHCIRNALRNARVERNAHSLWLPGLQNREQFSKKPIAFFSFKLFGK